MNRSVLAMAFALLTFGASGTSMAQAETHAQPAALRTASLLCTTSRTAHGVHVSSTTESNKLQFPIASDIKRVSINDDAAVARSHDAKDSSAVISKVLKWLEFSSPSKQTLPKTPSYRVNANVGPSTLLFQTNDDKTITLRPAFYTRINSSTNRFTVYYLKDVIMYYQTGMESPTLLKSHSLYTYLKNNQWRVDFN